MTDQTNAELLANVYEAQPEEPKIELSENAVSAFATLVDAFSKTNIGENKENVLNDYAGTHRLDEISPDNLVIVDADHPDTLFPVIVRYTNAEGQKLEMAIEDETALDTLIAYLTGIKQELNELVDSSQQVG